MLAYSFNHFVCLFVFKFGNLPRKEDVQEGFYYRLESSFNHFVSVHLCFKLL